MPDGYNTEGPEHLHIEYAKVPWRASNKVKPLPQMINDGDGDEGVEDVIEDAEGVTEEVDVVGTAGDEGDVQPPVDPEPTYYLNPSRHMAATPTVKSITIQDVIDRHGASNIIPAITKFLTNHCGVPGHDILLSSRNKLGVWHKLSLYHSPPPFSPFDPVRHDVVRASPQKRGSDAIWDVALYLEKLNRLPSENNAEEKRGIERYRTGRVCAFFNLPEHIQFFYPGPLAYLELFTPFNTSVSPFNKLESTKPDLDSNGLRRTLVVPVSDIFFTCHLVPKFHLLSNDMELHSHADLLSKSRNF
ncbi:hypothetical protein FRC11_000316, partial [Ceratobasidium sp. 423]